MNLLLLGGNNPKNKEWIEKIERSLRNFFEKTKIQYYDHWLKEGSASNPQEEYKKMIKNASELKDFMIFAKSMGVGLALHGIKNKDISPKKCIFVGSVFGPPTAAEVLKDFNTPSLFIQQTNDKYNSFENIKMMLDKNNAKNFKLTEVEGGDHRYSDVQKLKKLIKQFLNK